ncbi:MAG: amidohydrolase family protein, partial [Xanthomonadales bacterium]|nr:amidohydrolase family protein [Xanthomonadales bacterium]
HQLQDSLLAALELVRGKQLDLATVVTAMAHNPAERFQLRDRGFLREGGYADLVLVSDQQATDVTVERVLSRCGWSPFEGRRFSHRVLGTWVNGALAFDGQDVVEHGAARPLQFNRD